MTDELNAVALSRAVLGYKDAIAFGGEHEEGVEGAIRAYMSALPPPAALVAERDGRPALSDQVKRQIAATTRAEDAEAEAARLREQVTRLQAALIFWMPGVTEETDTAFERSAGDDAHLLAGFDGDAPKSCWGDVMVEREARLREALKPSAETKAAYSGEFTFSISDHDEDGNEVGRIVPVPWDTIKQIMAAIRARTASET